MAPGVGATAPPARRVRTWLADHVVARFLLTRCAAGLVVLFVVSILIFVGTEVLPGDAATAILGRDATPQALEALREKLSLDEPAAERYLDWLGDVLHGDLGETSGGRSAGSSSAPISTIVADRSVNTLILAGVTVALLVPLGLVLGTLAAARAGRPVDRILSYGALGAMSVPEFVTGVLLVIVFAGVLHWLPAVSLVPVGSSVFSDPAILVLPVLTLLAATLAYMLRMVRAGMTEALRSDYVESARLQGLRERRVLSQYALRNNLAPAVQVTALNIQWLIGGIIVTEYIFAYPGLGQALVQAVNARDIPFVQSVALLIAAVYVALNILADLLVIYLVPRLRTR